MLQLLWRFLLRWRFLSWLHFVLVRIDHYFLTAPLAALGHLDGVGQRPELWLKILLELRQITLSVLLRYGQFLIWVGYPGSVIG